MRTASLDDVIRMKEAADRWKDRQALPELRWLRGDPRPDFPRGFDPFKDFPIEADDCDPDWAFVCTRMRTKRRRHRTPTAADEEFVKAINE